MRSFSAAGALALNRSGGSQIKSMWQSAEMTSYFMACPPCGCASLACLAPAACATEISREQAEWPDGSRTRKPAVIRCDRDRFRPDLSGPLCEPAIGEGRRLCDQDRAAAGRAGAATRRAGQERDPAIRYAEPKQA